VLRTQWKSKPQIVGGVERSLTRNRADLTLHWAEPLRVVVGFVVQGFKFVSRLTRLGRDLLVLGQFGLAANTRIGRVVGCTGRRHDDNCANPVVNGFWRPGTQGSRSVDGLGGDRLRASNFPSS
jgi:hypothetical protein